MSNLSKKSGCLGIFLDFLQGKSSANAAELTFPYGLKDAFLSPAERSFYGGLQKVIPKDQYLLTKVNLSDLFYVRRPHENRKGVRQRNVALIKPDGSLKLQPSGSLLALPSST